MNKRQKGMVLSNYIADQIIAKGLDPRARADGGSGAGNREKADVSTSLMVLGQQIGIEAKNHTRVHIPEWWEQTKKLETLGCEPVLVFKEFGERLEETKCVIYLDTFLELLKNQKGAVDRKHSNNQVIVRERAIEQIISAAKILSQ